MLWAICCYFNPAGYQTKKINYDLFRAHLSAPLITVELSYTHCFELSSGDAEQVIQIQGKDILWQKECLLNIALQALPRECTAVAWLDADVIFDNPNWPQQTLEALNKHIFVQPFCELLELEQAQSLTDRKDVNAQRRSFTQAYSMGEVPQAYFLERGLSQKLGLAPGKAWAGRRAVLERLGLYDAMILGGGDRAILNAMLGEIDAYIDSYHLSAGHATHYRKWAEAFYEQTQAKIGYIEGCLTHLWHGSAHNRHYQKRQTVLMRYNFDPYQDLQRQSNQVWQWASHKPELHDYVAQYFENRKEDTGA